MPAPIFVGEERRRVAAEIAVRYGRDESVDGRGGRADEYGVSPGMIHKLLREAGVVPDRRPVRANQSG